MQREKDVRPAAQHWARLPRGTVYDLPRSTRRDMRRVSRPVRQRVVLGLIQSKPVADPAANLRRGLELVRRAAGRGARIICLPELYRTPYFPQAERARASHLAETIPGESTAAFSALARELAVVVLVPLFERVDCGRSPQPLPLAHMRARDRGRGRTPCPRPRAASCGASVAGGRFFNSVAVIDADGRPLGTYRKVHIPHDPLFYEKSYFEPGDLGFRVFRTRYASVAALICYDQWFPEAARASVLAGADILFYPTAIGAVRGPKPREGDWREAWETVQRGHAVANGVHVAAVNRVGPEGELRFFGNSFVADAFGNVLKRAGGSREEVLVVPVDLSLNRHVREGWGFLRNRRPECYASLVDGQAARVNGARLREKAAVRA